jgi:hypothetical protein
MEFVDRDQNFILAWILLLYLFVIQCFRKVALHLQMVLEVIERTIMSKNCIKQLHNLPVLHFKQLNTMKQQHTSTETSILTTKSTYRSLRAQRLFERTVHKILAFYVLLM